MASQSQGNQGQGNDGTVTIYVNTDPHEVQKGKLSYDQIVRLAYPDRAGDASSFFKVSYRLGQGHSELKSLAEGAEVEAQKGMIFNVTYENRS